MKIDNTALQGMWQMLSEILTENKEKLPVSLNEVIYGLCDGSLIVVQKELK